MDSYIVNQNVLLAIKMLEAAGYEAYLVGGSVRDLVLDEPANDYDLATNATLEESELVFQSYKTQKYTGKGMTLGVVINHTHFELSPYKGKNLEEDLKNRDFTMNSMAYHPEKSLYDPYNGIYDMSKHILKCVDNPDIVFQKDPVRILRAIRFYCTKKMKPDFPMIEAMQRNAYLLKDIKPERLAHEIDPVLTSEAPASYIREFSFVFQVIFPELGRCIGFQQRNAYWHHLDVFEHTMKVLDSTKNNPVLRYAALFHDIGKPACFTVDEKGIGHFYGHPKESARIAEEYLYKYKYNHSFIERVTHIILYHDYDLNMDEKHMLKFLYHFGTRDLDVYFGLRRADILGQNPKLYDRIYQMDDIAAFTKRLIDEEKIITYRNLAIKGNDLEELGYQGEEIGKTLEHILKLVIQKKLKNNPEKLFDYAAKYKYQREE